MLTRRSVTCFTLLLTCSLALAVAADKKPAKKKPAETPAAEATAKPSEAKPAEAKPKPAEAAPAEKPKAAKPPKARPEKPSAPQPPEIPGGKEIVVDTSPEFLKRHENIRADVLVAKTPPTVEFAYFPGQTYTGHPWSNWGDSLYVKGKYYSSFGDHLGMPGNCYVYEFNPETKKFRLLFDARKLLNKPEGHYTPGKIHSRLDMGTDGWIYFSTHRGSTTITVDKNHYEGDWLIRCHPETGKSEIVAAGPLGKYCLPTGQLDGKRDIFYGSGIPGDPKNGTDITFFAYDVKNRKMLYRGTNGPSRVMILSSSTGRVYYIPGQGGDSPIMRFDPATNAAPVEIPGEIGMRAVSEETPQNIVYTISSKTANHEATFFAFHTKTEKIDKLDVATVGTQSYITSLDADPSGRYLYYVPGAHGGNEVDGSPVVQYDTKLRQKKIIAFLGPYYTEKYGCTLRGTYSVALSTEGDKLYINWNAKRVVHPWDSVAMTVIHIPASERPLD